MYMKTFIHREYEPKIKFMQIALSTLLIYFIRLCLMCTITLGGVLCTIITYGIYSILNHSPFPFHLLGFPLLQSSLHHQNSTVVHHHDRDQDKTKINYEDTYTQKYGFKRWVPQQPRTIEPKKEIWTQKVISLVIEKHYLLQSTPSTSSSHSTENTKYVNYSHSNTKPNQ
jgi:hypothetical protein